MKERAKEMKAESRRGKRAGQADGEGDLLAKIGDADRSPWRSGFMRSAVGAPALSPKTWYGMPAYANDDGKVVCFFQSADKFKARYATFGFNDDAHLDQGSMWPTSWALTALTAADESTIEALVRKAVS
jgi:hypothetical protein